MDRLVAPSLRAEVVCYVLDRSIYGRGERASEGGREREKTTKFNIHIGLLLLINCICNKPEHRCLAQWRALFRYGGDGQVLRSKTALVASAILLSQRTLEKHGLCTWARSVKSCKVTSVAALRVNGFVEIADKSRHAIDTFSKCFNFQFNFRLSTCSSTSFSRFTSGEMIRVSFAWNLLLFSLKSFPSI